MIFDLFGKEAKPFVPLPDSVHTAIARYIEENLPLAAFPAESTTVLREDAMAMPSQCRAAGSTAREAPVSKAASLEELLREMDAGFSETLLELIDRAGKKDSEVYSRANVSRQHFSKIRNNPLYRPTKATAIAFAIALELDLEQTGDLIGRAGYALTRSSKFDLIIMYFIERRIYDLFEINSALYEFDQPLLGV